MPGGALMSLLQTLTWKEPTWPAASLQIWLSQQMPSLLLGPTWVGLVFCTERKSQEEHLCWWWARGRGRGRCSLPYTRERRKRSCIDGGPGHVWLKSRGCRAQGRSASPGAAATAGGSIISAANPRLPGGKPGRSLSPSCGNCLMVWSTLGCKDPRDVLSVELPCPSKPLCPKLAEVLWACENLFQNQSNASAPPIYALQTPEAIFKTGFSQCMQGATAPLLFLPRSNNTDSFHTYLPV